MSANLIFTQPLGKMMRHPLNQPPGVDEDQCRTMLYRKLHDAGINLLPHFVGRDRTEKGRGYFDSEVKGALVTDVDDDRISTSITREKMRDIFNWFLGRRQADAKGWPIREMFEPFERKRKVRAAFVIGDGVDFVHDYGFNIAQNLSAALGCEQNIKRLGRRDQNVRRMFEHRPPLMHERVAGSDRGANLRHEQAALSG